MTSESTAAHPREPVGRGPKVHRAVLAATVAELAENGYTGLTVEKVARRSGVHKTTVYRRWKDRESLVADAIAELSSVEIPAADTGDVDADLRAYARSLVTMLTSPVGRALRTTLEPDAARNSQLVSAKMRFLHDRFQRAAPMIMGAAGRGQLPAGTDPGELVRAVIAPIYLRLLVTAEPVDRSTADAAAAAALAAARAGVFSAESHSGGGLVPRTAGNGQQSSGGRDEGEIEYQ
jgi:AcrR family transcriptional regulator